MRGKPARKIGNGRCKCRSQVERVINGKINLCKIKEERGKISCFFLALRYIALLKNRVSYRGRKSNNFALVLLVKDVQSHFLFL